MRAAIVRVAAIGALLGAPGASAKPRVVDYSIDQAKIAEEAQEQGLSAAPLPPTRSAWHVGLDIAPAVDHEVMRAAINCSGWTVENPLSRLLRPAFAAWDRSGATGSPQDDNIDLVVRVTSAATFSRCVLTGELTGTCITRVSIDGSVARTRNATAGEHALHVEIEKPTKLIGLCAGLTRGIGLVSREAAAALFDKITTLAPKPAGPG